MKQPPTEQIRFFLYLTKHQSELLLQLRESGLSASTIARQALRKCNNAELQKEDDTPRPERCNVYLTLQDAATLDIVATRENCQKAVALRMVVSTYLTTNAEAIKSLFG